MHTEELIGSTIDARIVSIQGYGLILEKDGMQIVVFAPDVADFDQRSERYKVGDSQSVRLLRCNEKTGQWVGTTASDNNPLKPTGGSDVS